MATIRFEQVQKKFGRVNALKNLSFQTEPGEFSFLLGPSGAGKTTILSLIAGILPASHGRIYFDDRDITDLKPRERDVAIAFESYALYPNRTVMGNIRFPLDAPIRKKELSEAEKVAKVHEIARMLQIEELLDRFPRELSGGQRQRVALGRTLVRRPTFFLLDEPIAHLDAKLRHQMRGELKRLQQEMGIATFCASPDQSEAVAMADRIFLLNKGVLEQVGKPDELYFHPSNEFVALMLGEPKMSIFPVDIVEENQQFFIKNDDVQFAAPDGFDNLIKQHNLPSRVDIGLRHTDLEISFSEQGDGYVPFTIDFFQINGQKLIITAQRGNTRILIETLFNTEMQVNYGDPVWIRWDSEHFYVFDTETKQSLV
jgi:multiple sugar transport system ATP-binding protein